MASAVRRLAAEVAGAQAGRRGRRPRPILRPPPRSHDRVRAAAASRRSGSSPAGWRSPAPRCPAPSRGRARTGPGRPPRRATRSGSIPIEPVSIAASSLRMSPNMFSVRITSKWRGADDELHRGVVDEHVLELDVRELLGVDAVDGLAPQAARLEDVGLVDARHAAARGAERDAGDPLDLLDASRRKVRRDGRRARSSRRSRCRRSARGRRAGRCPR